jgi:starch-binding outer membrane protein, SusD/RagB family
MKNKICAKIFIVSILVFIWSCNEDLLEYKPSDRYTEDIFWQNEAQAQAGLAAIYNVLRLAGTYGGTATPLWQETLTPNATHYHDPYLQMVMGEHSPGWGGPIQWRWSHCYRGIGRANALIDQIDNVTMDAAKRNLWKAEAKFLRSLFYKILINHYGDVPLILEKPQLAHAELPRTPKSEVLNQILTDLDEVAGVLPVNAAPGRPTRGAALAIKTRLYLYNGMWNEAAATAKQVMDMQKYSLFPNYRGLFMPENQSNNEVIFEVVFQAPLYGHSFDLIHRQYNTACPLRDLIDAYLMADGSGISDSPDYNPNAYWENRDPRFRMTLVWPGSIYMGREVTESRFAYTGFTFKKYSVYDESNQWDNVILNAGASDINYQVIRYADILLMYAEAKTELDQIDQSVYDAINQVRARAGMVGVQHNDPSLPTYVAMDDQAAMRQTIRLERRIEFAGEGFYLMDILRWRTAHISMNGPARNFRNDVLHQRLFREDRDYLWPVPLYQMDENPNLVQNPGW